MIKRRTTLSWLLAPALGSASSFVYAQSDYPNRAISMLVPFPPGGVADTVARPIAEAMGRFFGQSVYVENKGGAGGGIGIAQAAKSKPDGYNLLMALSSIVVLPEADKVLQRKPMYQLNQLTPIARFTADPTVLVVRDESPWRTYAEFIEHVQKNPGALSFGSSGNYGTMHIPMEQLRSATKTHMTHVPYTGAGPAIMALLGGQVDALATGPSSVAQHIQSGKVRGLAHWGNARLDALPDVPSLTELGVPITYSQWAGLFVPTGTPPDAIERLRAAARHTAQDTKAKQALASAGTFFQYLDQPEFEAFVKAESQVMSELVKGMGKLD